MNARVTPTILLLVLFFLVGGSRQLATFATDWMWFNTIGQPAVFTTTLMVKAALGIGAGLFVSGMVWLNGAWALRLTHNRPVMMPPDWRGTVLEQALRHPESLGRAVRGVALAAGALFGLGAVGWWSDLLAWWHASEFGYTDPILGLDASFYMFTLPILEHARLFAVIGVFLGAAASLAIYVFKGAVGLYVPEQDGQYGPPQLRADAGSRRHLASLAAAFTLLYAAGIHLDRFSILFSRGSLFDGPGYSDVQALLPLLTFQAIAYALAGFLLFQAIDQLKGSWFFGAMTLVVLTTAGVAIIPGAVQRLVVDPNELDKEAFYISEHVRATRVAWGLDQVEEANLSGDAELTAQDIADNGPTIKNVRLWDHKPLLKTFSQLQEIRTYYEFHSVDNDRYMVNGELRQTMLSPRELEVSSLPSQARTWVNETMVYTHGYGLALGPVNQVTKEGLPNLWVEDLPPVVAHPELRIDRPEIYFGEHMENDVFVRTGTEEFDYPTGDGNAYSYYEGQSGVPVGGFASRLLMALRLGDIKILLSNDLTGDSRILLYRRVLERVGTIAPFLVLDGDPYMVIADGRLVWIVEAYTHSNRFPYASHEGRENYVRNSFKITVDAWDGNVTFYRLHNEDPVADAWGDAFPELFTDIDEMPEAVADHLRYPQGLFAVQAKLFATYHMTNNQIFYNREDEWEIPSVGRLRMEPYYTIMTLPGEEKEEFILMLPFTPHEKENLAAWMVARSDGDAYGKLRVYQFPKDRLVYGPSQVVARIQQNDLISEKLTLWNQQTSEVVPGTLLVIPIEESLIYVQPLYLRAEQESIPELKRVIVSYENQIAMEPTLEKALARLFGSVDLELDTTDAIANISGVTPFLSADADTWRTLVNQAEHRYAAATAAAREARWADYGAEIKALGAALEALKVQTGADVFSVPDDAPAEP